MALLPNKQNFNEQACRVSISLLFQIYFMFSPAILIHITQRIKNIIPTGFYAISIEKMAM